LVKRLIGVPGDRIAMFDNKLVINGEKIIYKDRNNALHKTEYLGDIAHIVQITPTAEARDNFTEITVPERHYLVFEVV
jgi:signal peptidase I